MTLNTKDTVIIRKSRNKFTVNLTTLQPNFTNKTDETIITK